MYGDHSKAMKARGRVRQRFAVGSATAPSCGPHRAEFGWSVLVGASIGVVGSVVLMTARGGALRTRLSSWMHQWHSRGGGHGPPSFGMGYPYPPSARFSASRTAAARMALWLDTRGARAGRGRRSRMHYRDRVFPRRIILIRHGQSEGNINKRLFALIPDWKQHLTKAGREQAKRAGVALRALLQHERVAFIVSPYLRTKETYYEIAKCFNAEQCTAMFEPRLREQEWGMFQHPQDQPIIKRERERVGHFYYRFPRGESGADVYDRVSTFLDSLNRCYRHDPVRFDNVVIVSHGLTSRLFLMRLLHWDVETFENVFNFEPASFVVLERQPDLSYLLATPLTTSEPDQIRKFFVPGIEPIYRPQVAWKRELIEEESVLRAQAAAEALADTPDLDWESHGNHASGREIERPRGPPPPATMDY